MRYTTIFVGLVAAIQANSFLDQAVHSLAISTISLPYNQ